MTESGPKRISMSPLVAVVRRSVGLLRTGDRKKYGVLVGAQMVLSLLDLVGVLLIGVVAVLALTSYQGTPVPGGLVLILARFGLVAENVSVLFVGAAAAGLLLAKSGLTAVVTFQTMRFLGRRQAEISEELTERLLSGSLEEVQGHTSQRAAYALTNGIYYAVTLILSATAMALGELAVVLVLGVALLFVDVSVSAFALLFFVSVGLILHRSLSGWSARSGRSAETASIEGVHALQDSIATYRETFVLNRRRQGIDRVGAIVARGAKGQADTLFIGQFPRSAYEAALVVGAIVLTGWQINSTGLTTAIGTLAIFLAAGTRMMPSLLRLNGLLANMRGVTEQAQSAYALAEQLRAVEVFSPVSTNSEASRRPAEEDYADFSAKVEVTGVTFAYGQSGRPSLRCVSFLMESGSSVAVVGRTGSGKSTLIELVVGLIVPSEGTIRIGGMSPNAVISRWPGTISYVPQNVALIEGTVRENVALSLEPDQVTDDQVWGVLRLCSLDRFLADERDGLDTRIGDRGVLLSGGQRQRLGLARALLSRPKMIVLDEATSALDGETEVEVAEAIRSLHGHVTTLTVAHRLSTVKDADQVIYLEEGRLVASGTFDEVRNLVPDFDAQANLMGL